ncbi:hypothetical protein ACUNWD_03180 [Sunxiuqinia sp. A32]
MKTKNILNTSWLLLLILLFSLGCEDHQWSEDYDINLPLSVVNSISTKSAMVSDQVSLTGTVLDKVSNVWIGKVECKIVDGSQNSGDLSFIVPRRAISGPVVLKNLYRRVTESDSTLVITYPDVEVTEWPSNVKFGRNLKIKGANVDLITAIKIGSETVSVLQPSVTDEISIPTAALNIAIGDLVNIEIVSVLGDVIGAAKVTDVPVVDDSVWEPLPPVVMWDFENNVNPYQPGSVSITSLLNGNPVIAPPLGDYYWHSYIAETGGGWKTFGILESPVMNISDMHQPYLTFQVNSNDTRGYMYMWFVQDGVSYEAHFNSQYNDDYAFDTNGWEWRSYPLDPKSEDAGEWKKQGFDWMKPFSLQLKICSGNVSSGPFELNLDNIQITDGKFVDSNK